MSPRQRRLTDKHTIDGSDGSMHWLIPILLVLFLLCIAGLIVLWVTHGFLAALGVIVGLYLTLWVLEKLLPIASRSIFSGVFDRLAGPMKDASVKVHSIRLADETDRLADHLGQVDEWFGVLIAEEGDKNLSFDAGEVLHEEGYPSVMQESYLIDMTIRPPEPDTAWTPHGLGLRSVADPTAGGAEIVAFRLSSGSKSELAPFEPQMAFEEITGTRRVELLARLDAKYPEYALEYLHADHWATVITLPPPPEDRYARRFTKGVVERLTRYPELSQVTLWGMPVTDADVSQLAKLQKLRWLDLTGTSISDACVPDLVKMTSLKDLMISDRQLSIEAIRTLQNSLPDTNVRHDQLNPFG